MSAFEIRPTANKGRALFASKAFQKGEAILEEVPLVSSQFSWNAEYKYLACDYCMKPLETAEENLRRLTGNQTVTLPYPECCTVQKSKYLQVQCPNCPTQYCSAECLTAAADRYHKFLCLGLDHANAVHPLNVLNEAWRKIHYPPETTTIRLVLRLLAMYKQTNNRDDLLKAIQDFHHEFINENLMISHKMQGENFQQDLDNIFALFSQTFDFTDAETFQTPDTFKRLFALIGENGQGIGTSSFADWVKNATALELTPDAKSALDEFIDACYEQLEAVTGLQFLNNEGSALYPIESKANHSCIPNAQATFPYSNHVLKLIAIQDIQPGDEICISYLDECFLERSRHSRQKELSENYLFVCSCPKCIEQKDDPDVTSDEEEDDDDAEDMDDD